MLDVIIVGAGFSGIAAARKLHQSKKSFIVLEARDRIGGRVYTKNLSDDLYVDLGGQWIGPSQTRMYELCEEYGVEYFETYDEGNNIIDLNEKIKTYKGIIPKMDILSLLNLDWVLRKLERMAKSIPLQSPWSHAKAGIYDQTSMEAFLVRNCHTQACLSVMRVAAQTIFAANLENLSLLHTLFYIKSGTNLNTLINVKNGAQQHRLTGGMQPLLEKIAGPFRDQILLGHVVAEIHQSEKEVSVIGKDFSFSAKKVIIAIPPPLVSGIRFQPPLSTEKTTAISHINMGKVGKCFAIYEKPFWRNDGFSGQILADPSSPFQAMYDCSPKDGNYGIMMAFTISDRAGEFFKNDPSKRKEIMSGFLVRYFGEKASNPLQYLDYTMTDEVWSGGCYAGIYPLGAWTNFQDTYSKSEGNIIWAGTETSDVWFGYIEGAVRAGEKAVGEILDFRS
jgi:monoamine oxidase